MDINFNNKTEITIVFKAANWNNSNIWPIQNLIKIKFDVSQETKIFAQKSSKTGIFKAYNLKFGNIFVQVNASSWIEPFTEICRLESIAWK